VGVLVNALRYRDRRYSALFEKREHGGTVDGLDYGIVDEAVSVSVFDGVLHSKGKIFILNNNGSPVLFDLQISKEKPAAQQSK